MALERALGSVLALALSRRGRRPAMAPHTPPQRGVEGVREGFLPLMRPDAALNSTAAQELVIGLRLSLLQASRHAGDNLAAPGSARGEA